MHHSPRWWTATDRARRLGSSRSAPAGRVHEIEGVLIEDFAVAAELHFAVAAELRVKGFNGYRERHVIASLVQRGLLDVEEYRAFRLVQRPRHVPTAEGREAGRELQALISVCKECLAEWVSEEQDRALSYLGRAGAAILLLEDLYPQLETLAQQLRDRGGGELGDSIATELLTINFDAFEGLESALEARDFELDLGGGGGDGGNGGG